MPEVVETLLWLLAVATFILLIVIPLILWVFDEVRQAYRIRQARHRALEQEREEQRLRIRRQEQADFFKVIEEIFNGSRSIV